MRSRVLQCGYLLVKTGGLFRWSWDRRFFVVLGPESAAAKSTAGSPGSAGSAGSSPRGDSVRVERVPSVIDHDSDTLRLLLPEYRLLCFKSAKCHQELDDLSFPLFDGRVVPVEETWQYSGQAGKQRDELRRRGENRFRMFVLFTTHGNMLLKVDDSTQVATQLRADAALEKWINVFERCFAGSGLKPPGRRLGRGVRGGNGAGDGVDVSRNSVSMSMGIQKRIDVEEQQEEEQEAYSKSQAVPAVPSPDPDPEDEGADEEVEDDQRGTLSNSRETPTGDVLEDAAGQSEADWERVPPSIVKQGWLLKTHGSGYALKKKYFALDASSGELHRYRVADIRADYVLSFGLRDAAVLNFDPMFPLEKVAFAVTSPQNKTLHLRTATVEEKEEWIEALQRVQRDVTAREAAESHLSKASRYAKKYREWRSRKRTVSTHDPKLASKHSSSNKRSAWKLLRNPEPMTVRARFVLWSTLSDYESFAAEYAHFGEITLAKFTAEQPEWERLVFSYFHARVARYEGGSDANVRADRISEEEDDDEQSDNDSDNDGLGVMATHASIISTSELSSRSHSRSKSRSKSKSKSSGHNHAAADDQPAVQHEPLESNGRIKQGLGVHLTREQRRNVKMVLLCLSRNNSDIDYCPMLLQLASQLAPILEPGDLYSFLQHIINTDRNTHRLYLMTPKRLISTFLVLRSVMEQRFPKVMKRVHAFSAASAAASASPGSGGKSSFSSAFGGMDALDQPFFSWWREWVEELWCFSLPHHTAGRCQDLFMFEGHDAFLRTALGIIAISEPHLLEANDEAEFAEALRRTGRELYDIASFFKLLEGMFVDADDLTELRRSRENLAAVPPQALRKLMDPTAEAHSQHHSHHGSVALPYYAWAFRLRRVSQLLGHPQDCMLVSFLDPGQRIRLGNMKPVLLYRARDHGFGLNHMLSRCERVRSQSKGALSQDCILIVRTTHGAVIGAVLTDLPEMGMCGDSGCCVYRLEPLELSRGYHPHIADENFVNITPSALCIGEGQHGNALRLESSLQLGSSFESTTFKNQPLHLAPDAARSLDGADAEEHKKQHINRARGVYVKYEFQVSAIELLGFKREEDVF